MRFWKFATVSIFCLATGSAWAQSQDPGLEIAPDFPDAGGGKEFGWTFDFRIRPWAAQMCGDIKFSEESNPGDRFHIQDELGGDEYVLASHISIGATYGFHRIGLRYDQADFSFSQTLPTAQRFDETLYAASEVLKSEFQYRDLSLDYDQLVYNDEQLWYSFGASLRDIYFEARTSSASAGKDRDVLISVFPELRFRTGYFLAADLALEGEVSGSYFTLFDEFVRTYSVEGGIRWQWSESTTLSAGYRSKYLELTSERNSGEVNDVNLLLSGPFVSLEIWF